VTTAAIKGKVSFSFPQHFIVTVYVPEKLTVQQFKTHIVGFGTYTVGRVVQKNGVKE